MATQDCSLDVFSHNSKITPYCISTKIQPEFAVCYTIKQAFIKGENFHEFIASHESFPTKDSPTKDLLILLSKSCCIQT